MEEREIITNEEMINETEETNESSSIGTGVAVLIGCVLTLAVTAGGKKLKKVWVNHKAKKEQLSVGDVESVDCEDVEEELN